MPKTPGPQPGNRTGMPTRGKNGPGDRGPSDGVRHYNHPSVPSKGSPAITGAGGAGLKPTRKHSK